MEDKFNLFEYRFKYCLQSIPSLNKILPNLGMRYDKIEHFIELNQLKEYRGNCDENALLICSGKLNLEILLKHRNIITNYAGHIGINKIILVDVDRFFFGLINVTEEFDHSWQLQIKNESNSLLDVHSLRDKLSQLVQIHQELYALSSCELIINTFPRMVDAGRIDPKSQTVKKKNKIILFICGKTFATLDPIYSSINKLVPILGEYKINAVVLLANIHVYKCVEVADFLNRNTQQFDAIRKLWRLEQDNAFVSGLINCDIFVATVRQAVDAGELSNAYENLQDNEVGLFINCPDRKTMINLWISASYLTFECQKVGLPTRIYLLVNGSFAILIPNHLAVPQRKRGKDTLSKIKQLTNSLVSHVNNHLFISCQDKDFRGLNNHYSEILEQIVRLKNYQIDSLIIASTSQIKSYFIKEHLPMTSSQSLIATPNKTNMDNSENQPIISPEICQQRAEKWQHILAAWSDARTVVYLMDAEKLVYLAVQTPIQARLNRSPSILIGNSLDINDSEISYHRRHHCQQSIKSGRLIEYKYSYHWDKNNLDLNYTSRIVPVSNDELIVVVSDSIGWEWQTQYFLNYQAIK